MASKLILMIVEQQVVHAFFMFNNQMEAIQPTTNETPILPVSEKIYLSYVISVNNNEAARQLIAEIEADTGMTPASITDYDGNTITL